MRARVCMQNLQLDLEKEKNTNDKNFLELKTLNQEIFKLSEEKKDFAKEIEQCKEIICKGKNSIIDLNNKIEAQNQEFEKLKENCAVLQEKIEETFESITSLTNKNLGLQNDLETEKKNYEKVTEKIQQEKLYSERLNEQIIQERLQNQKLKEEFQAPDLDVLIETIEKSLKLDISIEKRGNEYFFDNNQVFLSVKQDFIVEARTNNGICPLQEFLTCPRALNKKVSQDSRIENEMESICSLYSTDKEKFFANPEKKTSTKKTPAKVPFKEKNSRTGCRSVERKRPFK